MKRLSLALMCSLALVACLPPNYPPTPDNAADSTFEVIAGSAAGTAWIAGVTGGHTQLVTAAHVCGEANTVQLKDRRGSITQASVRMTDSDADLCLIDSPLSLGRPMFFSNRMPNYGAVVCYVGAPHGHFGNGLAPYFCGNYVGADTITAPGTYGSSGAAAWSNRGVFGVVQSVDVVNINPIQSDIFHTEIGVIPIEKVLDFLKVAGLPHQGGFANAAPSIPDDPYCWDSHGSNPACD